MNRHEQLFEDYVGELSAAKKYADAWWVDLQRKEYSQVGTPQGAHERLRHRWPAGPAAHPRILAVVRKYWLACEALNQAIVRGTDVEDDEPEPHYMLMPEGQAGEEESERMEPEEDEEVYPHVFVLEWLLDGEQDDLAAFLGSLTYWPVGLDRDDRYT